MNKKYGLTAENLLSSLPAVLRGDKNMFALAVATAKALSARAEEIDSLRIYSRIDELPEDLLDILAYDFKVDWWNGDYSLEEKRQVLKDSWRVHRMLGTKAAVEQPSLPSIQVRRFPSGLNMTANHTGSVSIST